jgi:uncharacterized membrane protein YjjP (DUF1212 family)
MSMKENDQYERPDPVDALLVNAFDEALSGPGNEALVDQVMARIARQQRLRTVVLALFGLIAAVICMLSAIPLLDLLQSTFAGFSGIQIEQAESQSSLPVTVIAVAIAAAGGWLLLEEATA